MNEDAVRSQAALMELKVNYDALLQRCINIAVELAGANQRIESLLEQVEEQAKKEEADKE